MVEVPGTFYVPELTAQGMAVIGTRREPLEPEPEIEAERP